MTTPEQAFPGQYWKCGECECRGIAVALVTCPQCTAPRKEEAADTNPGQSTQDAQNAVVEQAEPTSPPPRRRTSAK